MKNRGLRTRQGPFPVTVEYEGRMYEGSYFVAGTGDQAFVTVWFEGEEKSTQAGRTGSEGTARDLIGRILAWRDFSRRKASTT